MAKTKLQLGEIDSEKQPLENQVSSVTDDAIAQRAYALYLARGREDGHDLEDWFNAERELREANQGMQKT